MRCNCNAAAARSAGHGKLQNVPGTKNRGCKQSAEGNKQRCHRQPNPKRPDRSYFPSLRHGRNAGAFHNQSAVAVMMNATLNSTLTRSKQCSNRDRVVFITPVLKLFAGKDGTRLVIESADRLRLATQTQALTTRRAATRQTISFETRTILSGIWLWRRFPRSTSTQVINYCYASKQPSVISGCWGVYGSPDPRAEGPTARVERIHQPRQSRSALFEETKVAVQTNGHSGFGKLF